ncbi:hypothetical protein CKALI_11245 [Corynebacterium kalinowskii]|uniref:Uncharacterized protein n=1 Tax=Corynebacterium kalinowskii TaxID=2675216 RepID=A0A6B8VG34_9CORY|nr:hypothetical protein [Corynebacterium kalinowskii]QGU03093.1 hypothetical protein CKALI_11245 [Corynebacterium kalinowskii]
MTHPFIENTDQPLSLTGQRDVVTGASVTTLQPYTQQGVKDVARQQAEEALRTSGMKTVPQMIWDAVVGLIKVVVHAITHPISTLVNVVRDVFGWLFGGDGGGREQELADQLTAQEQARQEQQALTYSGFEDRIAAVEEGLTKKQDALQRVVASGTGWTAIRNAGVVTVAIDAATSGFILPEQVRPSVKLVFPIVVGAASAASRVELLPDGAVNFVNAQGAVSATCTFVQ